MSNWHWLTLSGGKRSFGICCDALVGNEVLHRADCLRIAGLALRACCLGLHRLDSAAG